MKRLIAIQQELKAPKNQHNSFGGYNFRSCEDILEAVKPLLLKHSLALIITDEVTSIDGGFELKEQTEKRVKHIITSNRVYIKATATLYDEEGKIVASTSALAREEEDKTGMDASQLTGATSSYARKYALNGLFAIDDNKDADSTNKHEKQKASEPVAIIKEEPVVNNAILNQPIIEVKVNNDAELFEKLKQCKTLTTLKQCYTKNYKNVQDKKAFEQLKDELKNAITLEQQSEETDG